MVNNLDTRGEYLQKSMFFISVAYIKIWQEYIFREWVVYQIVEEPKAYFWQKFEQKVKHKIDF